MCYSYIIDADFEKNITITSISQRVQHIYKSVGHSVGVYLNPSSDTIFLQYQGESYRDKTHFMGINVAEWSFKLEYVFTVIKFQLNYTKST